MHIYLEFEEKLSEEEILTRQPQTMRIEVSSRKEAIDKWSAIKKVMPLPQHYEVRIHFCYHDEGKPCRFETIERR